MGKRAGRGFTVIELVVCLAVLAILATAALPLAEMSVRRLKERELKLALWEIRSALDEFRRAGEAGLIVRRADTSGYPATLQVLVDGVPSTQPGESGRKVYFLRRIPRDPFVTDAAVPADRTWGLRSYASPPDDPHEGDDVFDVYSRAPGVGINGIPYRQW
jgi:general secretion pathway protein G